MDSNEVNINSNDFSATLDRLWEISVKGKLKLFPLYDSTQQCEEQMDEENECQTSQLGNRKS